MPGQQWAGAYPTKPKRLSLFTISDSELVASKKVRVRSVRAGFNTGQVRFKFKNITRPTRKSKTMSAPLGPSEKTFESLHNEVARMSNELES
jgi:hypothetical protein